MERFGDSGRRKIGVGFVGDKDNNNNNIENNNIDSNINYNNNNIDSNVTIRVDPDTKAIGKSIVKSNFHFDIILIFNLIWK